jgi:catechol 2,3-dioxygenase-like lactoylglutathione lyase family enzyme
MKRLHVHLAVDDLDENIKFYSTLFAAEPTVQHADYAQWRLDDPRVNFAISNRNHLHGLDHLGIQVEDDQELQELKQRLDATQQPIDSQPGTACCYTKSDKHWITDPQGIAWETFNSLADIPTFNEVDKVDEKQSSCCTPVIEKKPVKNCCG